MRHRTRIYVHVGKATVIAIATVEGYHVYAKQI
jgi:hypothetical protein